MKRFLIEYEIEKLTSYNTTDTIYAKSVEEAKDRLLKELNDDLDIDEKIQKFEIKSIVDDSYTYYLVTIAMKYVNSYGYINYSFPWRYNHTDKENFSEILNQRIEKQFKKYKESHNIKDNQIFIESSSAIEILEEDISLYTMKYN